MPAFSGGGRFTGSYQSDADITTTFGRMRLFSPSADTAALAHIDNANGTDYAMQQTAAGLTILNSKASQDVQLRINGDVYWRVVGSSGNLVPGTTDVYNFGTTAARVKEMYQSGFHELLEMTAPAAGAANTCRIYAVDNGSGKTQLMAIFASGAAQQLAIEP